MRKIILLHKKKLSRPGGLTRFTLLALLGFSILLAKSQYNSDQNFILITGQLTNNLTGTPIPDHQVYITSDSLANNGFSYYSVATTDENGFYRDTVPASSNNGIINIYLYDYASNLISKDEHYRFVWDDTFLIFADFSIPDPNTYTDYQANFQALSNPLENNPLKVAFKDDSFGSPILSWEWDFGDGNYSELKDPEHTYQNSGIYMVTLTIRSLPPEFEYFRTSTIVKQVKVDVGNYYHLGGHIFANYFPIDLGLAYLYTFDGNDELVPLDTVPIDTLGYYYFYALPPGKYITKARLQAESDLYGQFMPTYIGNVYVWEQATVIMLEKDNWECHITLLPSAGISSGQAEIIGQIAYDTNRSVQGLIPAGNIEILLLDALGSHLTCGLSNAEGYFVFTGMPYGTFQLFPDVAGISTSPMFVTISEGEPLVIHVSMVIFSEEIVFSVSEPVSSFINNTFLLYPNPVRAQARISLEMKKPSRLTLFVTDLLGRAVQREVYMLDEGMQNIVLDLQSLPAGGYQLMLIPEDYRIISGKFLKFN